MYLLSRLDSDPYFSLSAEISEFIFNVVSKYLAMGSWSISEYNIVYVQCVLTISEVRMFVAGLLTILSLSARISAVVVFNDIHWIVYSKNESINIPGKVPGGIYSDLRKAHVIDDIFYRMNDVATRWVARDTWTYEGRFNLSADQLNHKVANVVFHGVDTVAFIELNDSPIGSTDNMFVRYVFDVKNQLKEGQNCLKVVFTSPIDAANWRSAKHFTPPDSLPSIYNGEPHANQLRKMQASFAWDWGPAFPSVGLWKPVELEFYDRAIIRSVTTHIKKKDKHWQLKIKAYLETTAKNKVWKGFVKTQLKVEADQKISLTKDLKVRIKNDGTIEADVDMLISENVVREWWPNGYGDQPLYELRVSIHKDMGDNGEEHSKQLHIGFRDVELVQQNAADIFGNNSAGKGLTFHFKVNGYPIFMKGSNWIPAHILPEIGSDKKIVDHILQSAVDAHMAMLRVWGGGVYESDYFYERCDQLGILIWQDFMFACAMYPDDKEFLDSVSTEIEQNVIRLQHHPSIALWAGNNENEAALRGNWYGTAANFYKYFAEYIQLYVNTIKPIVNRLDPGRTYVVSSPSNGLKSEEDDYVAQNPYDPHYGDTHYYNYFQDNWDMNIYPKTRFASEYGFQSLPSIETMKTATDAMEDFDLYSEYSNHRQHSPLGYLYIEDQMRHRMDYDYKEQESPRYAKRESNRTKDEDLKQFEKFIFYSQISQAISIKAETEYYRQSQADWYTMGALYWQLNDVWQAPSWSSIEYGGKWKLLHYYAKWFFAPVLVSPRLLSSGDVDVYLINDRFVPINDGNITIDVFNCTSLIPIKSKTFAANVAALSAKKQDITVDLWNENDKKDIFLRFSLEAEGVVPSSPFNYVFPVFLKDVNGLMEPQIQISVSESRKNPEKGFKFRVDIQVNTVVLFLWLEAKGIKGHFQDNGFVITQPHTRVIFTSKCNVTSSELKEAISWKYYMNTPPIEN